MALRRDRRGATLVEHALVLPLFLFLLLTVIEGAWQAATAFAVEHGARRAARWVTLGSAPPAGSTAQQHVARVVLESAGLRLDPSRLGVSAVAYGGHAAMAAGQGGRAGFGGPNDLVVLRVTYDSPLVTPLLRAGAPRPILPLRTQVVVQNEPYPGP
ncbi:TadE/TadG family type IV pilus assembly protein [Roseococcus sp. DSY-14]|uniref:TadE/TadG family type IV pilus assembly protein n=1 Tax=Roseococcus sp. DSY-14 TaxID=3369650 RepID=UPI00387AB805